MDRNLKREQQHPSVASKYHLPDDLKKRSLEEIPFHLSNAQEQSKKYADFPDYLLVQTPPALAVTHNRMIGDGQMCDTQIKHCFRLSNNTKKLPINLHRIPRKMNRSFSPSSATFSLGIFPPRPIYRSCTSQLK